jgi:hypothetical protein
MNQNLWIRRMSTLAVTLLAGLAIASCGGSDDSDEPVTSTDPVAATQEKLEAEGISVSRPADKGEADAMLLADGVRIGFFSTPAKAEATGGSLVDFFKNSDQGFAEVNGNVVYLMTVTTGATPQDEETFDDVVSIAESD